MRRRTEGQSLVIIALVMPVLVALLFAALEYQERTFQHALLQDGLQQASRSGAQTFEYRRFAQNATGFRTESGAASVFGVAEVRHGCRAGIPGAAGNVTTPPTGTARAVACNVLITNLRNVRGLRETPEQTANRVTWTIYAGGGTCTFPGGQTASSPPDNPNAPLVCATMRPQMTGLGLFGPTNWMPQIDAADTLDRARP